MATCSACYLSESLESSIHMRVVDDDLQTVVPEHSVGSCWSARTRGKQDYPCLTGIKHLPRGKQTTHADSEALRF